MKQGLKAFDSEEVAALRIAIAFIVLFPFIFFHLKINFRKYLLGLLLMGILGSFIPAFLFTKSETKISSSLAGMLNALTPIFTILIGRIWLKQKISFSKSTAIFVGFVASGCLMAFDQDNALSKNMIYGVLVIIATFFYGISLNSIKKYLNDLNSVASTAWAFTIMGPFAIAYLFSFTDFTIHLKTNPGAGLSLFYISILAIVGTAISLALYNYLIQISDTIFASSCTYLIPVVAMAWGMLDGENVSSAQIVSVIVIIISVYFINKSENLAD